MKGPIGGCRGGCRQLRTQNDRQGKYNNNKIILFFLKKTTWPYITKTRRRLSCQRVLIVSVIDKEQNLVFKSGFQNA